MNQKLSLPTEPLWPEDRADLTALWPEKGPEYVDWDTQLGALTVVCKQFVPDDHWTHKDDDEPRPRAVYIRETDGFNESLVWTDPAVRRAVVEDLISVGRYLQHETTLDVLAVRCRPLSMSYVGATIAWRSDRNFQYGEHDAATDGTVFEGFVLGTPRHWINTPRIPILTANRNPLDGTVDWQEFLDEDWHDRTEQAELESFGGETA